jgi:hypothetical protein
MFRLPRILNFIQTVKEIFRMKAALRSVLVCLGLLLLSPKASSQIVIGMFDELTELYPDSKLDNPKTRFSVDIARGTTAGVHFLLKNLERGKGIRFQAMTANGIPVPGARWYRMIEVFVSENTGLDRSTEKFSGMTNPFVIRRAPFRIYEALNPVSSPLSVDSSSVALRLEIPVDSVAKPGNYTHKILIQHGEQSEVLRFSVTVHGAIVPPLDRSTISYVNWHNVDNICKDEGVEKWTEPFWASLAKYARLMVKGRQNTFWFIWKDFFTFDTTGNIVEFHRDRLERYIKIFLREGMKSIQGCPFTRRRDWNSNDMLLFAEIPGGREIQAVSEEGKRIISAMAGKIVTVMRENNWDNRWLQGVFDEPTEPFVDRYKEVVSVLRKLKPDILILEATMTTQLSGVVNIWCPQVQEYQAHREFFDQRKAKGDRVWVYTCLVPGGPWLNRLCDQERLRQVYVGWACAKFDLQGFLHWGFNFHGERPFEELVRFHAPPNEYLPAGDSHIVYPGKEGPMSSQRFEAHRIGMEDFELLAQLKNKDSKTAQKVIDLVFQAFDQYNKDVPAYRNAKAMLLESLDQQR